MSISQYSSNVERLTKQKANLEKQVAREEKKIADLQGAIAAIQHSITSSTSASTRQSKESQMRRKQAQLADCQKEKADLTTKISQTLNDLNYALGNLHKAEASADKKRREEEVRHTKKMTREIQKQAALYTTLSAHPLVIDFARLPTKIKVLFLAANPQDQPQLRLDEEIRAITEKIRASEYRDSVELISCWAVRTSDLLQALNEHQPHIIHFSGHGTNSGELLLQDSKGNIKYVTPEAITATLSTAADNIRVVVFNACFSVNQAQAVTQHIEVAIGMNEAIGDEAARIFAAQFYSAIGFGRSVQVAFDQAIAALMLEGILEDHTPKLFTRPDTDANEVVLVKP